MIFKRAMTFEELSPGDLIVFDEISDTASYELCVRTFSYDDPIVELVIKNGCPVYNHCGSMLTLNYNGEYRSIDETYFRTNDNGDFRIFVLKHS